MPSTPSPRRRFGARLVLALGFALAMIAVPFAAPSSAHTSLVGSMPADGAVLDVAPTTVEMTFTELVRAPADGIVVLDAAGARVDDGQIRAVASKVSVGVDDLPDGSYVAVFRVVSLDSHIITGSISFAVGEASTLDASTPVDTSAGSSSPWETIGGVGRFLGMAGVMIAAGGAVVAVACGMSVDGRIRTLLAASGSVGIVGLLLALPAQAARIGGGSLVWDLDLLLASGLGTSILLGVIGTLVVVTAVRRAPRVALLGAAAAVSSFSASGHTRTGNVAVEVVADIAHVGGGAVWLGGLAVLLAGRRRAGDDRGRRAEIARFSTVATVAVVVVGAAGLALSLSEVASIDALTSTGYGRTLLIKAAIVGLIGCAGLYNHFHLLPRLLDPEADAATWTSFRRTLGAEALGMVVVLALTAGLVNQSPVGPARTALTYEVATDVGPVLLEPTGGGLDISFADGVAIDAAELDSLDLQFAQAGSAIPPIERTALRLSDGRFRVDALVLPSPGDWDVTITIRLDRFSRETFRTTLPLT